MARPGAILIATVSVGAGHIRAAEAVREALIAADPTRDVDLVDVLNFGPRWARSFYRDVFLRIAALSRDAAYRLYIRTDKPTPDREDHMLERVVYRRFRDLVAHGPWRDVVCTHFLPCQVVHPDHRPALHLVVTDFALHRFWVQPNVDNFFVATDAMAAQLRTRLPRAAAFTTGIPVLARFGENIDSVTVRRDLGIAADAPVALIMGGGWGLGIEEMVHHALNAMIPKLTVIAVCGANQGAYERVGRMASPHVRAFAHVDDVARLMAASDIVVSKPGGVSTSEALTMRKPLLLTAGVPGQEDRNALELTRLGVADLVAPQQLGRKLEEFFQSDDLRRIRLNALESVQRNRAAEIIASHFTYPRQHVA